MNSLPWEAERERRGGGGDGAYINQDPAPVVQVVGLHGVIGDRAAEDEADGDEELPEGQALHGPGCDLPACQPHNQRQQWTQMCPDVACTPCTADVYLPLCAGPLLQGNDVRRHIIDPVHEWRKEGGPGQIIASAHGRMSCLT